MGVYEGKIRESIAKGNTSKAISLLLSELAETDSRLLDDITVLGGRFSEVKKKSSQGLISESEYHTETIKINYAILGIIHELGKGDEKRTNNQKKIEQIAFEKFNILLKKHNYFEKSFDSKIIKKSILNTPDFDSFEEAINFHKKVISSWASNISFKDSLESKDTRKVYVDLEYFLVPRRLLMEDESASNRINIREVFKTTKKNLVILGQPGAGKTTTMKMLVNWLLANDPTLSHSFSFPIVIRLRELNSDNSNASLFEKIYEILGIPVLEKEHFEKKQSIFKRLLLNLIDDLKSLIILDGLDELNPRQKEKVISDIREITDGIQASKFILTSRAGDYEASLENTKIFEISPLNQEQIKIFILNWLQNQEKSNDLYQQIQKSPFADTSIRPLTLGHLCALYERHLKIPEKPKTVYRKVVNLLIEEWDLQRSIVRGSKYSHFELDRKFEFLSHLAFNLTTQHSKTTFTSRELSKVYLSICQNFGLPSEETKKVVDELESHTGIIFQSGYDKFEFAHKSIQEYLTAEYFVKLPIIPNDKEISKIPSEVALAIALSSNPTLYFTTFIFERLMTLKFPISFYNSLFDRLVIEKPDFYKHTSLGVSVLALYTACFLKFNLNNQEANFTKWEIFFEKLLNLPAIQESVMLIKDYYVAYTDENITTVDFQELSSVFGVYKYDLQQLMQTKKQKNISLMIRSPKKVMVSTTHDPKLIVINKTLIAW